MTSSPTGDVSGIAPDGSDSSPSKPLPRRFEATLHGLRGMAVLYVVASHLGNSGLQLLPFPLDEIGKVGVWIFFGLSAWLLTARLRDRLREGSPRRELAAYAIHRIFRIYPLYLVVLLAHLAIGDIDSGALVRHLLLLEGRGELWAIPTEFRYYLVIPLLALLPRRIAVISALLGIVASMAWTIAYPQTVTASAIPLLPKAVPFLVASLFAIIQSDREASRFAAPLGLAGLLVLTAVFRHVARDPQLTAWMPWVSLAIALCVAGLLRGLPSGGWLARVFESRALVWIGQVSFGLYLEHLFVLRAIGGADLPIIAKAWLILGASIVLASATFLAIERPGIRLGAAVGARMLLKDGRSKNSESNDAAG